MATLTCYIRATALIGFQELVEASGGDHLALLAKAGIDAKALIEPDSLISYLKLGNLYEIAAQELGRPSFGLEFTLRAPPHFPPSRPDGHAGAVRRHYGEWVEAAQQYCRHYSNGFVDAVAQGRKLRPGYDAQLHHVAGLSDPPADRMRHGQCGLSVAQSWEISRT